MLPRRQLAAALLAVTASAGCADRDLPADEPLDQGVPTLRVTSPARGTILGDVRTVEVTGTVVDPEGDALTVLVNGVAAAIDADGAFVATLPLVPGTTHLAVVAEDAGGNRATETRAVLAGPMVPLTEAAPDALIVGLSDDVIVAIGDAAARWLTHGDLAPTLAPTGPLFEVGWSGPDDCLFGRGRAGAMTVGGAAIDLFPQPGGLRLAATLTDVAATLDLEFAAACVDGDAGITARVGQLDLQGTLTLGIEDNELAVTLVDPSLTLAGLDLGIDGVPLEVSDLIDLDTTIGPILALAVERLLAPIVTDALGGLSEPYVADVFGTQLTFEVLPVQVDVDDDGVQVRLDSHVAFAGAEAAQYLFVANQLPDLAVDDGLVVGVADDALTQLLAGFWAAGGLRQQLELGGGDYGEIGVLYDAVHLDALLPPTVSAHATDGHLQLVIGDLLASFVAGEHTVTEIALNATVELAVQRTPAGLRLGTGASTIALDVLGDGVVGPNALDDERLEALLSFAGTRLIHAAAGLIGELPLPSIDGAGSLDLAVASEGGFLLLRGDLVP